MELAVQKLTQSAFAPYGEVLAAPETPGREYYDSSLASGRADAWPSLSLVLKLPIPRLPIEADLLPALADRGVRIDGALENHFLHAT